MTPTFVRICARTTLEVGYVATVAILAIAATSDPNRIAYPAFDFALGLSLPSLLLLAPVFYVVVSRAWNLTGADAGGITWPVTAAYVVVFTAAAVLNVGLVSMTIDAHHRRRRNRARSNLPG
jgi:hypothetical protein